MKRCISFLLAVVMIITNLPVSVLAGTSRGGVEAPSFTITDYEKIDEDKHKYINKGDITTADLGDDPTTVEQANGQIKNSQKGEIKDLVVDYLVKYGTVQIPAFQAYKASILKGGKMAKNISHTEYLPNIDGYTTPTPSYTIKGDNLNKYQNSEYKYIYKTDSTDVKVVDKFQNLNNPSQFDPRAEIRTEKGTVGNLARIPALKSSETPGFEAERLITELQIPGGKDFQVEMRYFRKAYEVRYDTTVGASKVRTKKLYYGQKIADVQKDPTKEGSEFEGWFTKETLFKADGTPVEPGTLIKSNEMKNYIMPHNDITFTAKWKVAPKAEYAVLFWTEKSDYDENITELRDKYDYVGLKTFIGDTNSEVNLSKVTPDGIKFPDIDLSYTSDSEKLKYFFIRNDTLTIKENEKEISPTGEEVDKVISSTGKTIYNIYYDRKEYELVFEKYYDPSVGSHDVKIEKDGTIYDAKVNPYTIKARFNQSLRGLWPTHNDIKSFPSGDGFYGWTVNGSGSGSGNYLDSPPYRLTESEFINKRYQSNTQTNFVSRPDITIGDDQIALGVRHGEGHYVHVDFDLQGFDGDKLEPAYYMYYVKVDTTSQRYRFPAPVLKGFTSNRSTEVQKKWNRYQFDIANKIRPDEFKMKFEDKNYDGKPLKENGYLKFNYNRNKYNLFLNIDPKVKKEDHEYGADERKQVPYDMKLKDLDYLKLTEKLKDDMNKIKPSHYPKDYEFKGWAIDPKGENLVEAGNETMPNYNLTLYAKWGLEDKFWNIKFDPAGGTVNEDKLIVSTKDERGSVNKSEIEFNTGGENIKMATVPNGAVANLPKPTKPGHTFNGWSIVLYKKDGTEDNWYKDEYGVYPLYAERNPIVEDMTLRALWVDDNTTTATINHYYYDSDGNIMDDKTESVVIDELRRDEYYSCASKSNNEWILRKDGEFKDTNDHYRSKIMGDPEDNVFDFHYRQFRQTKYTVNYIDEKGKAIIPPEKVVNGKRDYDVRTYRDIPGYKLVSAPNLELNFKLNDVGTMIGIDVIGNGDGEVISDATSVTFKYKDIRIIQRKTENAATPEGYVRVIFKAEEGGNFGTDTNGNPIKELIYDVIQDLYFNKLNTPIPQSESNYKFDRWDKALLDPNTIMKENHTFIAKFVPESTGKTKIVPKGARLTAEDLVENHDDLTKRGAVISFDPVDTSTVGDKEVKITIRYPNGGTTTTAIAKVKVVPIVEKVTDESIPTPDYAVRVVFDSTADGKIGNDRAAFSVFL